MKLIRLTPDSPELATLSRINEEAFPINERLNLLDIIKHESLIDRRFLGIINDEGKMCGFFMIILTDDCGYGAYFAIEASLRGHGIGTKALKLLIEYCGKRQLIIDFEALDENAPNNDQRKRRRNLYLRNGFFPTGYFRYYMDCEFEVFSSWKNYNQEAFMRLIDSTRCEVTDVEFLAPPYRKSSQ